MKPNTKPSLYLTARRGTVSANAGFSLVELLTVILIIGIIAAIAIPILGDASDAAETAKNKRNAQSIASIYAAASAAGLSFADPGGDFNNTVDNTITGDTVSEGIFAGEFFGVPSLDPLEKDGAKDYLLIQGDSLVYNEEGL